MTLVDRKVDIEPAPLPLDGKATILFAGCRLQVGTRKLFVNGRPADLGARAVELLIALIEARAGAVTKDQIMRRVWPHLPMDEANLRVQMHAIRRELGADRHIIKTVQRHGYHFDAEVTILADEGPSIVPAPAISRPTETPPVSLPLALGPLFGRSADLAALDDHLAAKRLVTLVGPGGIGKTRLAVELGRLVLPRFPGGVRLVDLAPVSDRVKLADTAAAILGAVPGDAESPAEAIAAALGTGRQLLILDNCEHLVDAASALIRTLLQRAPGLSVLATSQESLQIPGEQIYRLAPLAVPRPDAEVPEIIAGGGAIDLFIERAREADPRFELDRRNAESIAEICRHLDGMPLALEMAAARLPLLGVEGLRAGLDDRLRLLKRSARAGATRHMTLNATIEWSYGLLDPAEQKVFRSLAIFAGSFSLDAAVAVTGGTDRLETIEILGRLVDKSLVALEDGARPHYRLLETLRLYGLERLIETAERDAVAERRACHLADLFDQAHEQWETMPDAAWVARYRPELDNVRAVLDWASGDPARARLAATVAGPFAIVWYNLGLITEGRRYVEGIHAALDRDPSPAAARFLRFASYLWDSTDRRRSLALLEQSASLYRQFNDQADLAPVLATLGRLYLGLGRETEAEAVLSEIRELPIEAERAKSRLGVISTLASFAHFRRDAAANDRYLAEALDLAEALNDSVRIANILANMAESEFQQGSASRAIGLGRKALALMDATDRQSHREWALANLASYLIVEGELAEARRLAEEALVAARDSGGLIVRNCLQLWALIGALEGRQDEAALLLGFVDRGYADAGESRDPTEQRIHDWLRATLPAERVGRLAPEGAGWSEARAMRFALDRLVHPY